MDKKTIIAVVVAVVIVVAAVGVYFVFFKDNKDVTFLIQDEEGVSFWIEGNGETVQDALIDAFSDYPEGTLVTTSSGISTLFDIGTAKDLDGNYSWWGQFSWKDGKWSYNATETMAGIESKNVDYFLIMYGKGTMDGMTTPDYTPTPDDAKIWDGKTTGTVFTIASETGLYFKVNGDSSENLILAFESACNNYNIPFVKSPDAGYGEGIATLFDFGWDEVSGKYWAQYENVDGSWNATILGMASLKCEDHPTFLVAYEAFGETPDIPV